MLICCSPSLPQIQNHHFSPQLPFFQSNSSPRSLHGSHKNRNAKNHLKAQSFPTKIRCFPTQTRTIGASDLPEKSPAGNLPGSAAPSFPGTEALASWLRSCTSSADVRKVHAVAVRFLNNPGTFVTNNLISAYASFHEISYARKLFDEMPDRSVVSWTAMMNGYLKLGHHDEIARLFLEMVASGVKGNSLTFVCLLKSSGDHFDIELGRQVHCCIAKGGWSNLIVDSAIVHFYAQCGDVGSASTMFDKMSSRDVVSWTTMITAYVQHSHGDKALRLFSAMQCDGFCPNEFTVCSILKACAEEKALRFGKQLHGTVAKKMYKYDIHVGSALVTMYARCGEVFDAQIVFDKMPRRNTITWTSMISGYAQSGRGEEAIFLFRRMKMRRVFVNNLTVVSFLSACGSTQSLHLGKEMHAQIIKNSIQENIHIGSTLVWFYCKCGEYAYAARILEAMPDRDVVLWTAMISGYNSLGRSVEALESLGDMLWDGVVPNTYTYSSVFKACAKLEALRYGRRIHAAVNKTPAFSNVFVGSSLIDMYMRCGNVTEAQKVFNAMPEHNLVTWKVMITGFAQNGLCEEALKYMYLMRQEGLDVSEFLLSTVLTSCGDLRWDSDHISHSSSKSCSLSTT